MPLYLKDKLVAGSGVDAYTKEQTNALLEKKADQIPITNTPDNNVKIWIDPSEDGDSAYYTTSDVDTLLANKAPAGYGYGDAMLDARTIDDTDGSVFEARLETLLHSLPNYASLQVRFYSYPKYSGWDGVGTLSKPSNHNNLAVFYGTDSEGYTFQKYKRDGVWSPLEWVNPPMTLGVEYRTTERYLGKPVYVKAIDFGALPNNDRKNVSIGASIKVALSCNLSFGKSGTYTYSAPFYGGKDIGGISVTAHITGSYVCCVTTTDYSDFTAVALCKYTKTTD